MRWPRGPASPRQASASCEGSSPQPQCPPSRALWVWPLCRQHPGAKMDGTWACSIGTSPDCSSHAWTLLLFPFRTRSPLLTWVPRSGGQGCARSAPPSSDAAGNANPLQGRAPALVRPSRAAHVLSSFRGSQWGFVPLAFPGGWNRTVPETVCTRVVQMASPVPKGQDMKSNGTELAASVPSWEAAALEASPASLPTPVGSV